MSFPDYEALSDVKDVYLPSPQEILAHRSGTGGWKKATLARWGVPWPPPKGWKADLEARYAESMGSKLKRPFGQRRKVEFR